MLETIQVIKFQNSLIVKRQKINIFVARRVDYDDELEESDLGNGKTFKLENIITHFEKRYKYPRCNEDQIAVSLVVLHAITPEVLIASPTFEYMDDTCIKQSVELDKLEAYLKTCEPPPSSDLYMQLIKGH